ncbi:MAG: tRNA lysidine(34) synthetase TilS [Bacilli bacterium]
MQYENEKIFLVALSGGPDSMALLSMLIKNKHKVIVAHVNYHTRKESNDEEEMVKRFCASNNIKCYVKEAYLSSKKGNFEAWARNLRYDFFKDIYIKECASALLVAHHRDDLVETYLMQKNRGAIVTYYGIKEETIINDMKVIRPLLSYRKKDLLSYCVDNDVPFSIDSSNLETKYTRNKIRHEIVEKMDDEELNLILQEIKKRNDELNSINANVKKMLEQENLTNEELLQLDEKTFAMYFFSLISKKIKLSSLNLSYTKVMEIRKTLQSKKASAIVSINKDYQLIKEYNSFILSPKNSNYEYEYIMTEPSVMDTKEFSCDFRTDLSPLKIYPNSYPLIFRNVKEGDIVQIGEINKKVSKVLMDEKVPLNKRKTYPIVLDKYGKVVYLPLSNSLSQKILVNKLKFVIK